MRRCVQGASPRPAMVTGMNVLTPLQLGNVFLEGEPIRVGVSGSGGWTLTNLAGKIVLRGRHEGAGELKLELPPGERGHYILAFVPDGGKPVKTPLAVLEPFDFGAVTDSPFGICTHFGQLTGPDTDLASRSKESPEVVPLLRLGGFKTHRDELTWKRNEPVRGSCVFPGRAPALHGDVRRARGGVADHPQLQQPPLRRRRYAAHRRRSWTVSPTTRGGSCGSTATSCAPSRSGTSSTARFPRVRQPNARTLTEDSRAHLPGRQSRAARPDGGRACGGNAPVRVARAAFQAGRAPYIDAVSVHPYSFPRQPDTRKESLSALLLRLQELIKKYNHGEPKPLQLTELGWPTHRGVTGVSGLDSARYAVRSFVTSLAIGVEKVYWYTLLNTGLNRTNREHNFGLLRHVDDPLGAYTPKPAYVALAVLARQLTGATFVTKERTPDPVQSFLFERAGKPLRVLWTPRRRAQETSAVVQLRNQSADTAADSYGYDGRRCNEQSARGRREPHPLRQSGLCLRGGVGAGSETRLTIRSS